MEFCLFCEPGMDQKVADWLGSDEARQELNHAVEQARQVEVELQKARELTREELGLPVTV